MHWQSLDKNMHKNVKLLIFWPVSLPNLAIILCLITLPNILLFNKLYTYVDGWGQ